MSDAILRDLSEGVLTLTLNRPEKLNAFTFPIITELLDTIDEAGANSSVRVVLIRGAGRAFSAGYDLGNLVAGDPGAENRTVHDDTAGMKRAATNWRRLWESPKPVVVAVQGYCLGGAVEIVLHADLVIASEDAVFGYPPVRGTGLPDTQMFVYHIGPQWTKRLLFSGLNIDAATAARIGLILEVVPRDQLEEAARNLAKEAMGSPAPLARATKNIVNHAVELMGYGALQRQNWNEMAMARSAPELQEFTRIAKEQGMKAALAWRDQPRIADNASPTS